MARDWEDIQVDGLLQALLAYLEALPWFWRFAGKLGGFALSALQRKISSRIFSRFQPLHETTGFFNSMLALRRARV